MSQYLLVSIWLIPFAVMLSKLANKKTVCLHRRLRMVLSIRIRLL